MRFLNLSVTGFLFNFFTPYNRVERNKDLRKFKN